MTVKVDSQPVTDQNMWYIDICCINNSISFSNAYSPLEKKTTFETHEQTYNVDLNIGLPSPLFIYLKFTRPKLETPQLSHK